MPSIEFGTPFTKIGHLFYTLFIPKRYHFIKKHPQTKKASPLRLCSGQAIRKSFSLVVPNLIGYLNHLQHLSCQHNIFIPNLIGNPIVKQCFFDESPVFTGDRLRSGRDSNSFMKSVIYYTFGGLLIC